MEIFFSILFSSLGCWSGANYLDYHRRLVGGSCFGKVDRFAVSTKRRERRLNAKMQQLHWHGQRERILAGVPQVLAGAGSAQSPSCARSPAVGLAFERYRRLYFRKTEADPFNRGNSMPARKVTRQDMRAAAEKYKNWGKWGPNDEIGTLNYTSAEDIIAATRLVKKGKVISLALNFDHTGPQGAKSKYPSMGRTNPIHTMLRTGTDAYSGVLDKRGIRAADDMVTMPLQCGTQWDGLGHVFYENSMWNGYDCREVTSAGAQKCGIEKTKNKMVGRGVLLDVARFKGVESLDDGYGITNDDLYGTAKKQSVALKRGDYVIVRTGMMERCQKAGSWDGYPGGDAPGFSFETLDFVKDTQLAALASDTWGCEVRPNESEEGINQPWHWITIPIMGMTMGEIFQLKELADDCAADKVYEFMFVAPALPITGAVGSPVNPLAIK
jgi:kynurenine formamidase